MIINVPGLNTTPSAAQIPVSDEVKKMTGALNVDDSLKKNLSFNDSMWRVSVFIASAVDVNVLDLAFGKGTESSCFGIGRALRIYSEYIGDTNVPTHIDNLHNLDEICRDENALSDIVSATKLYAFLFSNEYAKGKLLDAIKLYELCRAMGYSFKNYNSFSDCLTQICSDNEEMNKLCASKAALCACYDHKDVSQSILSNSKYLLTAAQASPLYELHDSGSYEAYIYRNEYYTHYNQKCFVIGVSNTSSSFSNQSTLVKTLDGVISTTCDKSNGSDGLKFRINRFAESATADGRFLQDGSGRVDKRNIMTYLRLGD